MELRGREDGMTWSQWVLSSCCPVVVGWLSSSSSLPRVLQKISSFAERTATGERYREGYYFLCERNSFLAVSFLQLSSDMSCVTDFFVSHKVENALKMSCHCISLLQSCLWMAAKGKVSEYVLFLIIFASAVGTAFIWHIRLFSNPRFDPF
jgi:hypothetical protein